MRIILENPVAYEIHEMGYFLLPKQLWPASGYRLILWQAA